MLPLLLGLGGSALAGTGALTALGAFGTPLAAGAIGSGLGSFLETGDLGQGIQTGLLSFLGGKALGSAFGGSAGAGAGAAQLGPTNAAAQAMNAGIGQNAALAGATAPALPGSLASNVTSSLGGSAPSVAEQFTQAAGNNAASQLATDTASTGMFGDAISKGIMDPYALGAVGTAGLTSLMGGPQGDFAKTERKPRPEAKAQDRKLASIPAGYRPGLDPELNYFQPYSLSAKGLKEGGITELADNPMDVMAGAEPEMMQPNDKEIINDAVDAIKGEDPQPEVALGMFLSRYGEEALQDLVQRVQSGEFDQNANVEEGLVNGAGDGMDDLIPAKLEGEDDVVLSNDEFIVPADVVSGLGNGSSDAGSKALYDMMDRVREMRTGKKEQPKQVPQGDMLPA